MARYGGGGEDFEATARELERLRRGREGLVAAERAYQAELGVTGEAEARGADRAKVRARAKREAVDVSERTVRVAGREAAAIDVDTAAIQRNTAARQRMVAQQRAQQVNFSRALRGARDPAFATLPPELAAQGTSQYALRQGLGIGSGRAQRIQEALTAGIRPGSAGATGPATRLQAAEQEYAAAQIRASQATKARGAAERRGDQAALVSANAEEELARAARTRARSELESARTADRTRATATREVERSRRGTDLIRHPELFGQPAYGQAQTNYNQRFGQVPVTGVRAEGGAVGGRYGGGSAAYDAAYDQRRAGAAGGTARQAQAARTLASEEARLAASLSAEERAQHEDLYRRVAGYMGQQAQATERARTATRFNAVELGTASQQMRRHGALTSEFIAAAARGETTLREMGFQAVATAGKFAGWTLAASAIYGAVGAIHQLGQGAIDSSSGVEQLRRVVNNVNGDQARQDFGDLSGRFNVPVATSADAVYRMGQVFHNQADATKAAEAALYSFKTGEVDVASSTQNLIAIQRAFGLGANDLVTIFDQINQAQNVFGIRIADTEAGLAKAAGTYRNAGGDLDYLLALFVAIQKATARSGTEIGTGIARGVNEIRKPINQARLQAQGVNVDPENFQATIQSALQAAKRPGADLQQIASGLFGNQYARLIAPVLRDQTTLNQAIGDTSPEKSKGSAQRELAHVLDQVDEQIHKVGVSLQRLGDALARAGLGIIPGAFLHALNASLDVAIRLVELFDRLPEPIRTMVSLFGQAAILMAVLRRFGTGDALAQRVPGLQSLANPDERARSLATRGLRDQVTEANNHRERLARQAFTHSADLEAAEARATRFDAQYGAREQAGTLPPKYSDERAALEQRRALIHQELESERATAAAYQRRALAARELAVVSEAELAQLKGVPRGQVRDYLRSRNIALPHGFDTPDPRGARYLAGQGAPLQGPLLRGGGFTGPNAIGPLLPDGSFESRGLQAAQRDLSRLESRVGPWASSVRGLGNQSRITGVSGRAISGAANLTASGMTRGASALASAGRGMGALGGAMKGLGAMIGPLDLGLIGLFAGIALIDHLVKQSNEHIAAKSKLTGGTLAKSRAELDARNRQLATIDRGIRGTAFEDPTIRGAAQTATNVYLAQQRARESGGPIPGLFYGEITKSIARDQKLRVQGIIGLKEFDRRMANHAVEIKTAYNQDDLGARSRALADLASARRRGATPDDFARRFGGLDAPALQDEQKATLAKIQASRRPGRRLLQEASAEYYYLTRALAGTNDPKLIAQLLEARETLQNALITSANEELQSGLLRAGTENQRRAAFAAARTRITRSVSPLRNVLRRALAERADARGDVEQDRDAREALGPIARFTGIDAKLKADRARVKSAQTAIRNARKGMEDAYANQADALAKLRDDEYSDRSEGRQVSLQLVQSATQDKGAQAAAALQSARSQLADARRTYGVNDRRYRQALIAVNQARQSVAEQVLADVQADNAILTARASGDPATAARAAVQAARNTLNALRQSHADPNDIKQAQAELISSQIAQANQVRQDAAAIAGLQFDIASARAEGDPVAQARIAQQKARDARRRAKNPQERLQALLDLVNANNQMEQAIRDAEAARFDLLESQTDDPVRRAHLETRKARRAIRGTQGAERNRALAEYNNARRAETQARVSAKEDDIDFDLFMGRIDRQTAIERYQSILKQHNLTKQMRRDVQRKIKELQNEADGEASGFGLDIGSIKMPTVYDVRRAIGANGRARSDARDRIISNMQNQVNVYVNDPNAADKVFEAIDTAMGTGIDMALKNAGMR